MIVLTTNTRGNVMKKDYADMTGPELVAAYNKLSGKDPIKKFKDRTTALARLAALETEKAKSATATAPKKAAASANGDESGAAVSENKLAAEFGARPTSNREKLLIALDDNYKKHVKVEDLLKAVYNSKNNENTGALMMVIKGAIATIDKKKLDYKIEKVKDPETKEISYGLFPK